MGRLAEKLRNFISDQQGAALVLVALSIVALIGFTALAVDGGYLYFRHTRLQDISDAIAIAAGIEVVNTNGNDKVKKDASFQKAIEYAVLHRLEVDNQGKTGYTTGIKWGSETGLMTLSFPEELSKVMVQMTIEANTFYARVLGTTSTPVRVTSVVQIGQASEQRGSLIPVAFFWGDYQVNSSYDMTLPPGEARKGNFAFLDYQPPNEFESYLRYGYDGTLEVNQIVETFPGAKAGLADKGLEDRINECKRTCQCWINDDQRCINDSCPRVVVVPILDQMEFFDVNGVSEVKIIGFAKIFIEKYDKNSKILTGWFLEHLEQSEVIEGVGPYTTQAVNLIR